MTKLILCTHTVFTLCLLSEIRKETVHISTDVFILKWFSPGAARLIGGGSNKSGRLEIYLNGQWGTVCDTHLTDRDASVICRQLGLGYDPSYLLRLYCCECMVQLLITCLLVYSEIGTALQHSYFGPGSGLFHYERLGCRGNENSLLECRGRKFVSGDCNHGNEAGVVCAAPAGETGFFILIFLKPHAD